MFKTLKGAFRAMKNKATEAVNTIKSMVADPKNRIATGVAVTITGFGLGIGLIASGAVQLRMA